MNKLLNQYQKVGLNIQSTFFAADLLGFFRRQNGVFYWTSKFYRRTMRIQMTASIFLLTLSETFLVCSDFTTPEVTTINLRDLCKVSIKHQMFKFRLNRQIWTLSWISFENIWEYPTVRRREKWSDHQATFRETNFYKINYPQRG